MKWLVSATFVAALVNAGVARAWSLGDALGLKDIQAEHRALHFGARQLPGNGTINVPPQCEAICGPVVTAIQTCTKPEQCCTAAFETGFYGCSICVGGLSFSVPQQTLDGLVVACASQGIAIPRLTFPGQDPNRPLSGLPGSSTAITTPTLPSSTTALNSTTALSSATAVNPPIPTSTTPPPQTTVTSPPTTTVEPNTLPDPTDTAFAPPNSSGWRTTSGGWWAGITVLTLGGILGGWCL